MWFLQNHVSSKLAIQSHCEANTSCCNEVNADNIEKEILKLNKNKVSWVSDIPVKIIKVNVDIIADFICENIDSAFKSSLFPVCLKSANVTLLHKKRI